AHALAGLGLDIVFPIHPRTRRAAEQYGVAWGQNVQLIDPIGYLDMLALQYNAHRVVTDSGGVQKETFLLGVPCVTLREQTEWPETVEAGWNTLVGTCYGGLSEAVARPLPRPTDNYPFGRGDAAHRIAMAMESWPPQDRETLHATAVSQRHSPPQ